MKRFSRLIALFLMLGVLPIRVMPPLWAQSPVAPRTGPVALPDKPDGIYHVGEKAIFSVSVLRNDVPLTEGTIKYTLSNDGVGNLGQGEAKLVDGKTTVEGSLDHPGVLRCAISFVGEDGKPHIGLGGAAFDPYKIEPTAKEPADFDQFWDDQKAELAKIPIDAQLTPFPQPNDKVEVFDITLANINGARVHGYFGKPKGDGPFPAYLQIPGAGVGSASPYGAAGFASKGFLALVITVHDLPNGQTKEFYADKANGDLKNYWLSGREDRQTYEFRRIILGCLRSIDYLTSRPEWDKKHVIVQGSSQGGALTLITSGLEARVTALSVNVPALCDHTGRLFGRPSGWPQLIPMDAQGKPDPKVLEVSRYYDSVNFARRINKPAVLGVGLIDTTCPATTVFSAYRVLRGPKQIDIAPQMGHAFSPTFTKLSNQFVLEQAGLK